RAAVRAAADARRGLPDARAAAVRRRRHQRLAQSLRRQWHQVLLARRFQAAGRLRRGDRADARWAHGLQRIGPPRPRAPHRHRAAKEKIAGVAGTLMTNLAFEKAMAGLGVPFARARVGDRYVLELLREKKWLLGGENSGHLICLDKQTTGDGIVSALQVLTAVRESGKTLAELTADLVMYPQVLLNVKVPKGFD